MKTKKQPKPTNKEIMELIGRLYSQDGQMGSIVDGIGNMFYSYLEYKRDRRGFAEYCKEQQVKQQDELAKKEDEQVKEEDEQNKQT